MMVECKALRDIESTIPSVGSRKKNDVFELPQHVAEHMRDLYPPHVEILTKVAPSPKDHGPSHGGPNPQRASSSLVARASQQKTLTMSGRRTNSARAGRSR